MALVLLNNSSIRHFNTVHDKSIIVQYDLKHVYNYQSVLIHFPGNLKPSNIIR